MNRQQALRALRQQLRDAGIESAALDARLLLIHALSISDLDLLRDPDIALNAHEISVISEIAARRVLREPVARILGRQEFYGLSFMLGPDTLIPRPETEMLVDEALRLTAADAPLRVLDLGTGTGCILLAILHERPNATGLGIDKAAGAVTIAVANAQALGMEARSDFRAGHWADGIRERFDLVVSNPPYIDHAVVPRLAPEVSRHDPELALDGGADGLDAYRTIIPALPGLLTPGGHALLEIGFDQAGRVAELAVGAGLDVLDTRRDLAGHDRMLVLAADA